MRGRRKNITRYRLRFRSPDQPLTGFTIRYHPAYVGSGCAAAFGLHAVPLLVGPLPGPLEHVEADDPEHLPQLAGKNLSPHL